VLFGTGGAPEGVLAAAALRCVNGDMRGRLKFRNNDEVERARRMGITDPNRIYTVDELAQGEVMFAATGVTNGAFLKGVQFFGGGAKTSSIVMRSKSGTVRNIESTHHFDRKPNYSWLTGIG
jgi:fructose-1,6-bisphosphatase II